MSREAIRSCYETIRVHSKSFALASRLLAPGPRDRAVVVYAWCRRADDAVDLAGADGQADALSRLREELEAVYGDGNAGDATLSAFRDVVRERNIPQAYPADLLDGMQMDVEGVGYESTDTLLRYCYCVAGTVGLMMCHVLGVSDERATRNAVHLGMAMQLTNICRDVLEDWERSRLYIPDDVLRTFGAGGLARRLGGPFPVEAGGPVARAVDHLLAEADRYYASGDRGLPALSWRSALSVRTARRVYSEIGARMRARGCDPLAGRAFVPTRRKLTLVGASCLRAIAEIPARARRVATHAPDIGSPRTLVRFPEDVLPV